MKILAYQEMGSLICIGMEGRTRHPCWDELLLANVSRVDRLYGKRDFDEIFDMLGFTVLDACVQAECSTPDKCD